MTFFEEITYLLSQVTTTLATVYVIILALAIDVFIAIAIEIYFICVDWIKEKKSERGGETNLQKNK